jgi:cell wall-associated NlpC family hydrolase
MRRRLSAAIDLLLVIALISPSLSTAAASYKIKQGDTLSAIATRHHTTVAKLTKANHLRENSVLALGKAISIPGQASPKRPNRAARPSRQACYTIHANADSVCLRSAASSGSHRVALLPRGTTMKLLARNGKWAKVALASGTCGYAYRPLLAPGAASKQHAEQVASSEPDRSSRSLIQTALACRGMSYRRGGTSRGGFDCSGFTRYVYAKYGISLPHSSAAQAGTGASISRDALQPGDLVFFQTNSRGISHVGIYIGNDNFVHAESRGRGVTVSPLSSSYYGSRYRGARRVE